MTPHPPSDRPGDQDGRGGRDRPIIFSAPTEAERFAALVSPEPNSGCWLWLGSINPKGYGRTGRGEMAHRASLRFACRELPPGLEVDHLCRVRCCVNPDHLEAVTHRENLLRGNTVTARAAAASHCPHGHAYSGHNLIVRRGKRRCRECDRLAQEGVYQPKTTRRRRRHLTPQEVDAIRQMLAEGYSCTNIAARMELSIASVSNIKMGKTHV